MGTFRAVLALFFMCVLPGGRFIGKCACTMHQKWCSDDEKMLKLRDVKHIHVKTLTLFQQLSGDNRHWNQKKYCDNCISVVENLTDDQMSILGMNRLKRKAEGSDDCVNDHCPTAAKFLKNSASVNTDNGKSCDSCTDEEEDEDDGEESESTVRKMLQNGLEFALNIFTTLKRKILNLKSSLYKRINEIVEKCREIDCLMVENETLKEEIKKLRNEQMTIFETQEQRIEAVKKIGKAENLNLYNLSQNSISNQDLFAFNSLEKLDPQDVIKTQNPVVSAFIDSLTENKSENKLNSKSKILKQAVAGECIMGARNQRYVSPLCAMPASIVYGTTGSKLAINTINQLLPSGSYDHLVSWLFQLHASQNSNKSSSLQTSSLFYAFDNNQRLLRSWLSRNFNKQVVQIMTNITRVQINDSLNIQFNENLHPSLWRKFSNVPEEEIHKNMNSSDVTSCYDEIISKYILKLIKVLDNKDPVDDEVKNRAMSTSSDTINCPLCIKAWKKRKVKCDICKINMRSYNKEKEAEEKSSQNCSNNSEKLKFHVYNPSENNDGKTSPDHSNKSKCMYPEKKPLDISLISPLFVNPGSKDSVKKVLDEIGKDAGIRSYGTGTREWCFVVCDGSPMTLLWQIIFENSGIYDWVVPITSLGHEEMNMTKGFVELVWDIIYQDFIQNQGYVTPKAQLFMKGCGNHHLSFDNLEKFREAIWLELLKPFKLDKSIETHNFQTYVTWLESRNNTFLCKFVLNIVRYLDSVFIFREGVRLNDSKLIETARYLFADVWFLRKHTKYQLIFCFEALQRHQMPNLIKQFLLDNESFSKSGRLDAHQGLDFILEEYNKSVKNWISGAAGFDRWENVILNIDNLAKIRSHFQNLTDHCKDSLPKFLPPFTKERNAFRVQLRLRNFFSIEEGVKKTMSKSTNMSPQFYELESFGTKRMRELFSLIITKGYPKNRKLETVRKIPVTDSEASNLCADERKTKIELKSEIENLLNCESLLACERENLKSEYSKVKNGTKDLLLVMLQVIRHECMEFQVDQMTNDVEN